MGIRQSILEYEPGVLEFRSVGMNQHLSDVYAFLTHEQDERYDRFLEGCVGQSSVFSYQDYPSEVIGEDRVRLEVTVPRELGDGKKEYESPEIREIGGEIMGRLEIEDRLTESELIEPIESPDGYTEKYVGREEIEGVLEELFGSFPK